MQTATKKGFISKFSLTDRRKTFANRIDEEIRNDNATIKMHTRTIENFETRGGGDAEYNICRIQKCQSQIEFLQEKIAIAEKKSAGVLLGHADAEISTEYGEMQSEMKRKNDEAKAKKAIEIEQSVAGRTDGDLFYKAERSEQSREKSMKNHYNKFLDVVDTLPAHISRNIENTPCNRGYKWRGVIFYGKLPEVLPDMIFEKRDGGTLITEITPKSYTVYFKDQNKQKHTVASAGRQLKPKFQGPATVIRN